MTLRFRFMVLATAISLAACGESATTVQSKGPRPVDATRIMNADSEPGMWMTVGRTYNEQRFSPLKQINDSNASQLGLAWSFDLDTARGQEATPLVVDGVMYFSTAWSKVKALDAKTGAAIWQYDPKVPLEYGVKVCCDVVNRGVAMWNGKIYVGTLDGRLIALNAANGEEVWSVQTTDTEKPYAITGAPRVAKGKVFIGNGGAEFGVRGYISAYDAETGNLSWRFYTVPGRPGETDGAASDKALAEIAAPTWNGEYWTIGGGGTVWDSIVYDQELDLLYFGVGNGSPWSQAYRGKIGDNLFLVSIVAVKPDTGEYVWHYQEVPGDEWDFTSVQPMMLADLQINGETRKVLMHAPKNGFFYVIDRTNGQLISAEPFAPVTWATAIDKETGRPVENPDARYSVTGRPWRGTPGPQGAHNWNPMAFSPMTGFVYVPVNVLTSTYVLAETFGPRVMGFNTGTDRGANAGTGLAAVQAAMDASSSHLLAWDPVNQKQAWRVEHPGPGNGGILATAGNLVFQGTFGGDFVVYRADNGQKLWSMPVQTSVIAGPMAYELDGEQYVAVLVGTGGALGLTQGAPSLKSGPMRNISRMLAFKLGGTATLTEPPAIARAIDPPPLTATPAVVADGGRLYAANCGVCHGAAAISVGIVPDLRSSPYLSDDGYFDIVLNGTLRERGMVSFAPMINRDEAAAIRSYVIAQAHETKSLRSAGP
jgi:alcohol dehydrogenase (cytochrome c)/quinohemoprotein ethanol dehydrogenase